MATTLGANALAQKMERQATDERVMMLRLFKTLIRRCGLESHQAYPQGKDLCLAATWCSHAVLDMLSRQSISGWHIFAKCTIERTVFQGLAHWRQ
jgi:hypothetical protein